MVEKCRNCEKWGRDFKDVCNSFEKEIKELKRKSHEKYEKLRKDYNELGNKYRDQTLSSKGDKK